jgi:thiamine biosynthesis lipoprotein
MSRRTEILMGTCVSIELLQPDDAAIERAFHWFLRVESCCSRFQPDSELARLTAQPGSPVPVSAMLFEAVRFAIEVAEETGGAFDPTVGKQMEQRGFDREYSTGTRMRPDRALDSSAPSATYQDVELDAEHHTITLRQPLLLDLGAVAKGLAIDLAARELRSHNNFAIDAGGDLYLSGHNADGEPWSVGIRHPLLYDQMIETVRVSNAAVCTSGNYEVRQPEQPDAAHIVDPRQGVAAGAAASVTVIAQTAMLADAMATAAFVLGPSAGIALLERAGVNGLIFTPGMARHATPGWPA